MLSKTILKGKNMRIKNYTIQTLAGNSLNSCPDSRSQEKPPLEGKWKKQVVNDIVCELFFLLYTSTYVRILVMIFPQWCRQKIETTTLEYQIIV